MIPSYDLIIIGAGPAGYVAALKAAHLGKTVAVIEERQLGGTCLNRGCIPTKTFLHSAKLLQEIKNAAAIGVAAGEAHIDLPALLARKEQVVTQLQGGIAQLFKAHKIAHYTSRAMITGAHEVTLADGEKLSGDKILIAAGSIPARPPIAGSDKANVITSDELLSRDTLYDRLVIIGGGVIGVELATAMNAMGVEVTIIEALDRLLANLDKEISQNLTMLLKKDGVNIFTGAQVAAISGEGELTVTFTHKDQEQSIIADGVLLATGRAANTQNLWHDAVAIAAERGKIIVNDQFQTTVPTIYAIGDCIAGGIQLAHAASAQAQYAVATMFGQQTDIDLTLIPACIYTEPEIATIGLSADSAKAQNRPVKTGKYLMSANGKSLIEQQKRGFIKVVLDEQTDAILGAQLMCARATDLIGEFTTAIANHLTAHDLLKSVRAHPTFGEAITEALEDALGCATHSMPKRK